VRYLFMPIVDPTSVVPAFKPVGIAYVAAALRQTGRYVSGLHPAYHVNPTDALLQKIEYDDIDVLCLGGLSADFSVLTKIISEVRKHCPDIKIMVGGGVISAEPEFIVQHLDIDFGCVGYGEETICEFAECLETGGDFSKIKGLIYRDGAGQITINPQRSEPENLDNIPFPALELFGFVHSEENLPILCARSCMYNCTFCFHPSGYQYRERSLDNIFEEIAYWKEKYDIASITFHDEHIGNDQERFFELCDRLKKLGIIFNLYLRVDIVTDELIKKLAESGCTNIIYGIESINQNVLDSMHKHITVEQIEYALKITRKYNIDTNGSLIFGDRIETYEMAKQSLEWWFKNIHYGLGLMLIEAYPGTALYEYGIREGRIKDKLEFLKNRCRGNLSAMSNAEYAKLKSQIMFLLNMTRRPAKKVGFDLGVNGEPIYCIACPCCGTVNHGDCKHINSHEFAYLKECAECGDSFMFEPAYRENHFAARYFSEYDFSGKNVAVWGLSEAAQYRIASNRKMREAVCCIVDRDYRRFEGGFLGFAVQAPKVLATVEFDILYVGSSTARESILCMAREIVGHSLYKKEIMGVV